MPRSEHQNILAVSVYKYLRQTLKTGFRVFIETVRDFHDSICG